MMAWDGTLSKGLGYEVRFGGHGWEGRLTAHARYYGVDWIELTYPREDDEEPGDPISIRLDQISSVRRLPRHDEKK